MSSTTICLIFAIIATFNVASAQVALGACSNFAVHGGSKLAFNGGLTNFNTGNVGMSPGTAITGNFNVKYGEIGINSLLADQCTDDRKTDYNQAKAATCPPADIRNELGGQTLFAGVYCDAGAEMSLNSDLILDGQNTPIAGVWVFQASSSLLTSLNTKIILQNGALPENVFWAVGTSATLATTSAFVGTLMTYASISLQTSAVTYGQALAGTAVTFETSRIGCSIQLSPP